MEAALVEAALVEVSMEKVPKLRFPLQGQTDPVGGEWGVASTGGRSDPVLTEANRTLNPLKSKDTSESELRFFRFKPHLPSLTKPNRLS